MHRHGGEGQVRRENTSVDAAAIKVETFHGEVLLSGFARHGDERRTAQSLARAIKGVKEAKNQRVARPGPALPACP